MARNSKRNRKNSRNPDGFTRVNPVASPSLGVDRDLTPSASYGSFRGAIPEAGRGYVYFPELDSEREVDSWSRIELAKRASALYNEVGLVRGTINGIARMVCGTGLMPQALTNNESWNDRIEKLFNERAESKNTFHLGRKFSFASSQPAILRAALKVGDVLNVLARDENNALRVGIYEGSQVGNGSKDFKGWIDGVLPDQHRAAIKYRLIQKLENGSKTHVDIPAENCLFVADYERIGQHRGLTCLYHAINRMYDRSEIMGAITRGIKVSNQHAYVIETDKDSPGPSGGPGAMSPRPKTIVQTSKGPMTMEKFLGAGQIEELKPGQSFKILHDQRPHPNVTTHLDGLVRDMAIGTGFHSEVIWNVAALGGANTRFVMASAQSTIEEKQEWMVESYCAPYYVAFVADAIANGDIEYIPDWYAHGWLTPGRMTVDFGRDGKLHLEQYKQGLITLKTLYGYRGEEWKRQITQYLAERAFMKQEAQKKGLTLQEAFPNFYGMNVGVQPGSGSATSAETASALADAADSIAESTDRLAEISGTHAPLISQ